MNSRKPEPEPKISPETWAYIENQLEHKICKCGHLDINHKPNTHECETIVKVVTRHCDCKNFVEGGKEEAF